MANTSAKMYSPSVQPTQGVRPSGANTFPGPDSRCQTYVPRQQSAPSGRPQADVPSIRQPGQVSAANSSSKRRANQLAVEITRTGSKSSRQTKSQTTKDKAARILPAVPDAPQPTLQGPPPTPRITRLPTPDLPELTGTAFCTCDDTNCRKLVHLLMNAQEKQSACTCNDTSCNKSVHLKMKVQRKKPSGPSAEQHS